MKYKIYPNSAEEVKIIIKFLISKGLSVPKYLDEVFIDTIKKVYLIAFDDSFVSFIYNSDNKFQNYKIINSLSEVFDDYYITPIFKEAVAEVMKTKNIKFEYQLCEYCEQLEKPEHMPSEFDHVQLLYSAGDFDVMLAYDDANINCDGSMTDSFIFMGHWNNGVK